MHISITKYKNPFMLFQVFQPRKLKTTPNGDVVRCRPAARQSHSPPSQLAWGDDSVQEPVHITRPSSMSPVAAPTLGVGRRRYPHSAAVTARSPLRREMKRAAPTPPHLAATTHPAPLGSCPPIRGHLHRQRFRWPVALTALLLLAPTAAPDDTDQDALASWAAGQAQSAASLGLRPDLPAPCADSDHGAGGGAARRLVARRAKVAARGGARIPKSVAWRGRCLRRPPPPPPIPS